MDEVERIKYLLVPLHSTHEGAPVVLDDFSGVSVRLGVASQDDCATIDVHGELTIVLGSDYVRGTKFSLFELGFLDYYSIGWYLAGANLSDIAAMGAIPVALLSVIRYPRDLAPEDYVEVIKGFRDCCLSVGALCVGGDTGSAERLILSGSALGVVERGRALLRTNGLPGHLLCLSGPTGLAGSAMKLARAGLASSVSPDCWEELLGKWRRVAPRVGHGRALTRLETRGACMDTSDGLRAAVETIAEMSNCRVKIFAEQIPISPCVQEAAEALGHDVLDLVFGDSVDFELLFTVGEGELSLLVETLGMMGLGIDVIGRLEAGSGVLLSQDGVESEGLPGQAWRHQGTRAFD